MQTCEQSVAELEKKQLSIIVEDLGPSGRDFSIKGVEPSTHLLVAYRDGGGPYSSIRKNLSLGDTLEKQAGAHFFLLKKKDMNLLLDFSCQNGNYTPTAIGAVKKGEKF